jgi:glycosyltransferase involved in cell wall biosynthesis
VVSNWQVSQYGRDLYRDHRCRHPNIVLLDAIYDANDLDHIRGHAKAYIHTHSRCGTAPSLVEAICLGLPIISFDVPANRETTHDRALYFSSAAQLVEVIHSLADDELAALRDRLLSLAQTEYRWSRVCSQYDAVFSGAPLDRLEPA